MAEGRTIRLSLSGFLFEDDYATQSLSPEAFCSLARVCGYAGVELRQTQISPDHSPAERREIAHLLDTHSLCLTGLTARGATSPGPSRDALLERYLELCAELGCPLLKMSGPADWLADAAERAARYGVRIGTNNHVGNITETVAGTQSLLHRIDHPCFGLLFDPMHLFINGEDPIRPLATWTPRIFNVLFQVVRPARSAEQAAISHGGRHWVKCSPDAPGSPPWTAITKALFSAGYNGWVTVIENAWPREHRVRIAADSVAFLTRSFVGCGWKVKRCLG